MINVMFGCSLLGWMEICGWLVEIAESRRRDVFLLEIELGFFEKLIVFFCEGGLGSRHLIVSRI